MKDLISGMESYYQKKFFKKHGCYKTKDMCDVQMCSDKAVYILNIPWYMRVIRFFKLLPDYQGAQYCKKDLRNSCYRLETPRKYWKELK